MVLKMNEEIKEGSTVLLYLSDQRKYIVKAKSEGRLDTDRGFIILKDLIGKKYGDYVCTNLGFKAYLLKPTLNDYIEKFKRITQVIYQKDLSYIVFLSGISSGSMVVEAGTGSGALTATLAHFVKPYGKVYTYEVRKEFLEVAKKNIKLAGLKDYVVFKNKNVEEGIDEKNVDAVFFDLPIPWKLLDVAYYALKGSGTLIIFVPTIDQLLKTLESLRKHGGYINIETYELMLRKYKTIPGEVRPMTWAVTHTGYIIFARKVWKKG